MNDLKHYLQGKGYPEQLLDWEIQRATNIPQDVTLGHGRERELHSTDISGGN